MQLEAIIRIQQISESLLSRLSDKIDLAWAQREPEIMTGLHHAEDVTPLSAPHLRPMCTVLPPSPRPSHFLIPVSYLQTEVIRGGMLAASLIIWGWWFVDLTTCHRPQSENELLHGLLLSRLGHCGNIQEGHNNVFMFHCLLISSGGERLVTCTNCQSDS